MDNLKQRLEKYRALCAEIKLDKDRLEKAEQELAEIAESEYVSDIVKGGYGGDQRFTITGYPVVLFDKKNKTIDSIKERISNNEHEMIEIEKTIEAIPDTKARIIAKARYLEGLKWIDIRNNYFGGLTGGYTEDALRMSFKAYLDRLEGTK